MVLCPFLFTGLVVPDVPLEETESLQKEAMKNKIELVCLFSRNISLLGLSS